LFRSPGAIVLSLNALALALVESYPARARALLDEVIELCSTPDAEISAGYLTGCVVAGRLRDWRLTLALAARAMYLYRWSMYPLQAATCLAECARAFADDRPEIAGVLPGGGLCRIQARRPRRRHRANTRRARRSQRQL